MVSRENLLSASVEALMWVVFHAKSSLVGAAHGCPDFETLIFCRRSWLALGTFGDFFNLSSVQVPRGVDTHTHGGDGGGAVIVLQEHPNLAMIWLFRPGNVFQDYQNDFHG